MLNKLIISREHSVHSIIDTTIDTNIKSNYIIGPSHIHHCHIYLIENELLNKELFANSILDSYWGIPIWSINIYNMIALHYNTFQNIYWIVSDYKFNNSNYEELIKLNNNELFLNYLGSAGNVNNSFMSYEHIEFLGNHSLKVIDYMISTFPNIKLIFWCLYKRTKANENSSYPKHLWYDEIKNKYKNNIIDIDLFTTPEEFNLKIKDDGGHPNKDGYILLDDMIKYSKSFPLPTQIY